MSTKQESNPVWIFCPILGITITRDISSLGTTLFPNATLIAFDEIDEFIGQFPSVASGTEAPSTLAAPVRSVSVEAYEGHPSSFIAVRGFGATYKEAYESAERQSRVFMGLLATALMLEFQWNISCRFPEHQHTYGKKRVGIRELGGFSLSQKRLGSRNFPIHLPPRLIQMTREELGDLLAYSPVQILLRSLAANDRRGREYRPQIESAIAFLYETIQNITPEAQVVGAVTVLEMLLQHGQNSNFKDMESRLRHFLGEKWFKHHDVEAVLRTRHNIVHSGQLCTEIEAFHAIRLAITSLLMYGHASIIFPKFGSLATELQLQQELEALRNRFPKDAHSLARNSLKLPPPEYLSGALISLLFPMFQNQVTERKKVHFNLCMATKLYATIRQIPLDEAYTIINNRFQWRDNGFASDAEFYSFFERHEVEIENRVRVRLTSENFIAFINNYEPMDSSYITG